MTSLETTPHLNPLAEQERSIDTGTDSDRSSIQERHPDWPQLNVLGYFSGHGDEDQQGMTPHIKNADIYFVEAPGSEASVGRLTNIARLPSTKLERFFRRNTPVEKELLGSNKIIASMDLYSGVPEEKELFSEIKRMSRDSGYLDADSYDQALNNTYKRYHQFAELNNKREDRMPAKFEGEMASILEQHPELKEKPSLEILFTMGSAHSARLTRIFKEHGIPLEREFPSSPDYDYTYSYGDELSRSLSNGREPKRELLERVYTENIVTIAWQTIVKPKGTMPDGIPYERFVASQFAPEEMEDLYQQVQDTKTLEDWNGIVKYLNSILAKNNASALPKTPEEFEHFASTYATEKKRKLAHTAELQQGKSPENPRQRLGEKTLRKLGIGTKS